MDYPAREAFFAHRFIRLMTKAAAAMEIGADGFAFLTIIAMQEDACRYTRPVNFWNSQLITLLGLKSDQEAAMRRLRDKCVKAGWLVYSAGSKSKPARYFVAIPDTINQIEDGGCDELEKQSDDNNDADPVGTRQECVKNPSRMRQESDNIHPTPTPIHRPEETRPRAAAQPEADPSETMAAPSPAAVSDEELIRPLARYVRTTVSDPTRSAEMRAELASIVREFGGKHCLETADRLKREAGGEKVFPEALERALAKPAAAPSTWTPPALNLKPRTAP